MQEFQEFIKSGGAMSSIPLLLFFCICFGWVARRLKLPSILGYMLGGILMGHNLLDLISTESSQILLVINHIALGLMSLTIGTHINFHRLKNSGRRVFFSSFFDITFPFFLVSSISHYGFNLPGHLAIILGALSVSTAPATIIAMVIESKSRGTLVNTLLPMVAINNVTCIIFFSLTINYLNISFSDNQGIFLNTLHSLTVSAREIVLSMAIALGMGFALKRISQALSAHPGEMLTGVFFMVMATAGISLSLNMNPMLPNLFMGIYISNSGSHKAKIIDTFEDIQHLIIILFFGMAGTHVNFNNISQTGGIIVVFILARFVGKYCGGFLGAWLTRSPGRIIKYLGFTTIPQAGVVIGLVILAYEIPQLVPSMGLLTAVVLISVNINEFIGPILNKWAFEKAGEAGQDRDKLIDFLGEEFIHPNLKGQTKEEIIKEMCRFLVRSHDINEENLEHFEQVVLARENDQSTALGNNVAIPHGIISNGSSDILGAMGLVRNGLDFNAPDGKKVYLIILLLTPKEKGTKHLKILAEIVKLVSDNQVREQLVKSKSAAEMFEVIHHIEHDKFNYFIDE